MIIPSEADAPTPPERGVFTLSTNELGRVRDNSASADSIPRSLSRRTFSLCSALEPLRSGRRGRVRVSSSAGVEWEGCTAVTVLRSGWRRRSADDEYGILADTGEGGCRE